MKNVKTVLAISVIAIFIFCCACKNKNVSPTKNVSGNVAIAQNVSEINNRDEINWIDATGKRQGHWIIFGRMQKNSTYTSEAKVEEGNYKDDLKDGEWTFYNPDGSVKGTLLYKSGQEVK